MGFLWLKTDEEESFMLNIVKGWLWGDWRVTLSSLKFRAREKARVTLGKRKLLQHRCRMPPGLQQDKRSAPGTPRDFLPAQVCKARREQGSRNYQPS